MNKIFLSHNSSDKPFVRKLADDLNKNGIQCWVDEAEIKVGDSLLDKISEGIEQSDYLAAVLSPSSIKSEWVKRELEIALNDEIDNKHVKVLPLLIKDCNIPNFLKGKLYADFRTNYNNGLNILLNRLSPKKTYTKKLIDSSKTNGSDKVLLTFKDDDRFVLRKKVNKNFTIKEIRKLNPVSQSLWVELDFGSFPLIQRIELFYYKMKGMRLSYMVDLSQLVSETSNKNWQDRVYSFGDEIWKNDNQIMAILETTDLAVNWGGPESTHVRANGEILYYFDNEWGYIEAQKQTKKRTDIDNMTMEQVLEKAMEFSSVVQKMISDVLSVNE